MCELNWQKSYGISMNVEYINKRLEEIRKEIDQLDEVKCTTPEEAIAKINKFSVLYDEKDYLQSEWMEIMATQKYKLRTEDPTHAN